MKKGIARRRLPLPEITTASTADIAFLLILFFMVTTVFRTTTLNLHVRLPEAEATQRILIRHLTAYIWVDENGQAYIDDAAVPLEMIGSKIGQKIWEKPDLVTILNVDQDAVYGTVDRILDQLKNARAYRITFATRFTVNHE